MRVCKTQACKLAPKSGTGTQNSMHMGLTVSDALRWPLSKSMQEEPIARCYSSTPPRQSITLLRG